MGISETTPVLDLKPLRHNPFLDGTVVYENAGGVLVPRSTSGSPPPVGNALLENRPSNASTQSLIDSARSTTRTGVAIDDVALRGYRNVFGGLDTERFSRAVDDMSDAQLDDFIQSVTDDLAASRANGAASLPRITANQALRRGSQFAGALGTAIDAYNLADAIVDPTNNPLDELGDIAGSALGGSLGAGLGPVGVLAGSLAGGWLGRQLGNLLQGDGARANSLDGGDPAFEGGQCAGIIYTITLQYTEVAGFSGNETVRVAHPQKTGPISEPEYISRDPNYFSGRHNTIRINDGVVVSAHSGFFGYTFKDIEIIDTKRNDGQPDTCGNPVGPITPITTAPTYAPTALDNPGGYRPTIDDTQGPGGLDTPMNPLDRLPDALDPAFDDAEDTLKPPEPFDLDDPPSPDELPTPRPQPLSPRPEFNPNPQPGCCEVTSLNIEQLLREIEAMKTHFQSSGLATLDLSACGETGQNLLPWNGAGLTGIYAALETLSAATNRLWAQVKCPPDATAAVPMAWDIKVHEHPQLIVLWAPVEGGSSRWAMHIPHPRSVITSSYGFRFPMYTKGSLRGTLILSDNSRVVVNGRSEAECKKVFNYVRTLIVPSYLNGAQEVFTKGTAKFSTREVKAVYVKAFAGHRDQAPLWAEGLKSGGSGT